MSNLGFLFSQASVKQQSNDGALQTCGKYTEKQKPEIAVLMVSVSRMAARGGAIDDACQTLGRHGTSHKALRQREEVRGLRFV